MTAGEVADALARFLRARDVAADVTVTGRATVGLSQETWFATVTVAGGSDDVVVRLPTAASGGRAIATQRAALAAVADIGVPAPRLRWWDDTADNPFGRPFLVMERLHGTVPAGWHDVPEPDRGVLAEQAVDAMVLLHTLDPAAAPDLRRPSGPANEDALHFYARRLAAVGLGDDPVVRVACWWLGRHLPHDSATHVIHQDLRMGNLVVDGDRLVGILDWEMAAIGDPLMDVAWCFVPVWEPPGLEALLLVHRYAAASGRDVDPESLQWHTVLAQLRLAYYAASGSAAFAGGASDDLRLAALTWQLPVHLERLTAILAGDPIV
jgi:aminoglycoside phosphotransferase (APT) family kinase protein